MGENSAIEWTDATVNFWWGCTKVGPGCDHCYAETWSKRIGGGVWGVGAPRRKIKGAVALILKLQNGASWFYADHDRRRRVFVQSMSDLFDTEVPIEWFAEAWQRIGQCDSLEVQIVTKRVSVVEKRLTAIGATWPSNAGLIISVVNQEEADRDVPRLLALKAKLGIPWVGLSMEPLLGLTDLRAIPVSDSPAFDCTSVKLDALTGYHRGVPKLSGRACQSLPSILPGLDWVIVGGESGAGARPMHPDWARSLRDQCAATGVPFLFKQWGEWAPIDKGIVGHSAEPRTVDEPLERWGKKKAGRLLDGVTHDQVPA